MARKKARSVHLPRSLRRMFPDLEYAIDADTPIEVSVKPSDCKQATPLDPNECALAKAVKREFHADAAVIGITSSYIIKGNKAIRYDTPEAVRREIVSFDRHGDFEPGEYHLPPKSPTARLGHSHSGRKTSGSHAAKRRIHKSARVRMLK